MTRRDDQRLADIEAAVTAIREHVGRGDLDDGLVFDAVRMRLIEIGEAVKDLPSSLLDSERDLPWSEIAGMRDRLAHRYFDTSHAIVTATVAEDLPDLERAVARLRARAAEL
ncbi:MAG: HepT-like ribonuclease domain-containing protein [Acidimicrobiales bacterium]